MAQNLEAGAGFEDVYQPELSAAGSDGGRLMSAEELGVAAEQQADQTLQQLGAATIKPSGVELATDLPSIERGKEATAGSTILTKGVSSDSWDPDPNE